MGVILRLWLALVLAVLMGGGAFAAIPPRPEGPVLDQADLLPPAEEAALDQKLRAYNARTGRALLVVTVASLDGRDIESYGVELGQSWGVGGKATDQGLILLVAPNERRVRFEVGYGLEEFLPDVLAGRIIRDTITPRFKAGDMAGGIVAGIDAAIAQLDRDPAQAKAVAEAAAAAEAQQRSGDGDGASFGGIVFWIVIFLVFMTMFGGGRRGRRYGRGGSNLPIILWGASEMARGMSNRGGRGFGGGGFGGGGGGGFGGFGGGGFGGGGASGGW